MEEQASPLALIDLLGALLAGALWCVRPELGPWPLLLILVGLVVRHLVEPRPSFELTAFDLAIGLFALSACIGLLIAYNWDAAAAKFWLILGGLSLYGAITRAPAVVRVGRRGFAPVRVLLAVLPSALAVYFMFTADYGRLIGKLPLLDGLFRWIVSWFPELPFDQLHPNVAGGIIAALLPLQLIALWDRKERYVLLPISAAALLLSASRGAWLALAAIATVWFVVAAARSKRRALEAAAAATAIALIVLAVLVVPTILAQSGDPGVAEVAASSTVARIDSNSAVPTESPTAPPALASSTAEGRATLFGNALGLAWDYAVTGLGLDGFQMAFSSYVLLLHVGHTNHAHNIFLDVWLGQGLLGLIATTWLLAAAVVALRRVLKLGDQDGRAWALAAAGSMAVMVLHGFVDDPFYATRGVVFMFVPFAVLAREQAAAVWQDENPPPAFSEFVTGKRGLNLAVALMLAMLAALFPPIRSQVTANMGALTQTRAELSVYEWPKWPIQDELRRSPDVELDQAVARYEKALALDGSNATANRRLGQILMSRDNYAQAGALLAAAHRSDYANRATRQLYGEWLAINGRPQEAAALWRTIDMNQGQLAARTWWFEHTGEPELAAALRLAASLR